MFARGGLQLSIADLIKRVSGRSGSPAQEVVGSIVDPPTVSHDGPGGTDVLVFRLDSRPDLVFRQPVRALAGSHKRGDRVKVNCRPDGNGTAVVEWIEKA
jgi:hypothetical protein